MGTDDSYTTPLLLIASFFPPFKKIPQNISITSPKLMVITGGGDDSYNTTPDFNSLFAPLRKMLKSSLCSIHQYV